MNLGRPAEHHLQFLLPTSCHLRWTGLSPLVRFIPKYFLVFDAALIGLSVSSPDVSLLAY